MFDERRKLPGETASALKFDTGTLRSFGEVLQRVQPVPEPVIRTLASQPRDEEDPLRRPHLDFGNAERPIVDQPTGDNPVHEALDQPFRRDAGGVVGDVPDKPREEIGVMAHRLGGQDGNRRRAEACLCLDQTHDGTLTTGARSFLSARRVLLDFFFFGCRSSRATVAPVPTLEAMTEAAGGGPGLGGS